MGDRKGVLVKETVPVVDYLDLSGDPHLVANECHSCSARYFDRRNACAACGSTGPFVRVPVATTGRLRTFTIVAVAPPGVAVPHVSAIVDCDDGTAVRTNIVGVEPDPRRLELGMSLHLTTYSLGADAAGTEAIAFAFAPVKASNR